MDFDFIIPLKKEDLLNRSEGCYSVKLIPLKDVVPEVGDIKFSIDESGCDAILDNFDKCFSFLYDSKEVSFIHLHDFYEEVIEQYLTRLRLFAERSLDQTPTAKKRAVNVIKMIVYTFSMYFRTYEEKLFYQKDNLISEPKKARMAKPNKSRPEDIWPWNEKKINAFSILYCFLQVPLGSLWQANIVEEPFVNLVAGCCYKTFENAEINQSKSKPLRDSAGQVLAVLILNYNHTMTFLPRIIELMKQHESAAAAVANTVLVLSRDFLCLTILGRVLSELLDVALEDPQTMGKSVAVFITELGEYHPHLFLSSVNVLQEFLSVDAYPVRNAVMVTYCEMVVTCFSEESLTHESVNSRNKILKAMRAQIPDENAYVRSKIIQLWVKLANSSCIPVDWYSKLLREINFRLVDKSTHVSKNAINFYKTALEHNPFGGKLRLNELNKEKEKEMNKLKEFLNKQPLPPEERWSLLEIEVTQITSDYFKFNNMSQGLEEAQDITNIEIGDVILIIGNVINKRLIQKALNLLRNSETVFPESKEIRCNLSKSDVVSYYVATLKKIYLRAAEMSPETIVPDYYDNINKMESTKTVVKYLEDCTSFIESINRASDTIYKLMFSTNPIEVLESIEFFTMAYKFQIGNAEKAVRDMLFLANSSEVETKDAVAKAYASLYLESKKTNARARALQTAQRLINLVKGLNQEQIMSLEEILQKWIETGQLNKEFTSVLFDTVINTPKDKSNSTDINSALYLINIVAKVNNSVVSGNVSHLTSLLKPDSDNYTIKLVCSLLKKLATTQNGKPVRYKRSNEIFVLITDILIEKYVLIEQPEYADMVLSAVDLVFHLCYKPEEWSNDILCTMYQKVAESRINTDDQQAGINTQRYTQVLLERLFIICGHIVFMKWQYCDRDVFNCLKKCHDGVAQEKQPDQSLDEFEMEADNIVAADDALYEMITSVCEKSLSKENTILHHISDTIILVCQCSDDMITSTLKASAAQALAKFMFTSSTFCESYFQLYATLMSRCKYDNVRSSMVLAFSDLLCRFPNIAEPWTVYVYSRLQDHSELVRLNTVTVLCYLISREMIKVRGQFAELLLHLEDPHPIIAEKVSNLLQDLSKKGNTIYNIIPDIISKLSNPDRTTPVATSTFKLIIGLLFRLVTKERQSDLLVEKLCARLKESTNERQWEDLAYCLSQLRFTERSFRKFTDSLVTFKERLNHEPVHNIVSAIITACSKSSKPNMREIAYEAAVKMVEVMTAKRKDDDTESSATGQSSVDVDSQSDVSADNNKTTNEDTNEAGTSAKAEETSPSTKDFKTPRQRTTTRPSSEDNYSIGKPTSEKKAFKTPRQRTPARTSSEDNYSISRSTPQKKVVKTPRQRTKTRPSSEDNYSIGRPTSEMKAFKTPRQRTPARPSSEDNYSIGRSTRKKKPVNYHSSPDHID